MLKDHTCTSSEVTAISGSQQQQLAGPKYPEATSSLGLTLGKQFQEGKDSARKKEKEKKMKKESEQEQEGEIVRLEAAAAATNADKEGQRGPGPTDGSEVCYQQQGGHAWCSWEKIISFVE